MIEVEVHNILRNYLRSQGENYWPHHLTMARLVARGLRLGRSALIQTGISPTNYHHSYRLSYLLPLFLWPEPSIVVAPEPILDTLLKVAIPKVQESIVSTPKSVKRGDRWPEDGFSGLLLTTPESWLRDRFNGGHRFPPHIPTLIDGVDDLETWTRQQLTVCIQPQDWNHLMDAQPQQREAIREVRVQLTKMIVNHPPNPYNCYLLETLEQEILQRLFAALPSFSEASPWQEFHQCWQSEDQLRWASVDRQQGTFNLYCAPIEIAPSLQKLWSQQAVVLIGGALDLDKNANSFRQVMGLGEITCLKFTPDRQNQLIQLYLPSRLPFPNTPQFQVALIQEIRTLLCMSDRIQGLTVLLINDVPLKGQVGATLAGEFGSRVQVETTEIVKTGILVTGWEFWHQHQGDFPSPHLLVIATLPLPSLENPFVAGQVAYHKQRRQDWFRLYLLPTALSELQRAVAPVRDSQGVVAILDNRVIHRSYGEQVLVALSPFARINYLDRLWLTGL